MISNRNIIGTPNASGKGIIIHDHVYMNAYPSYAFIDSSGILLGSTIVTPSDRLLFSYYIDGLLKSKSSEESFNQFRTELRAKKLSEEFLHFVKQRFGLNESDACKLSAPYLKLL